MKSAIPAFFALLLVCSLPAITVVAATPGSETSGELDEIPHLTTQASMPTEAENTTNRLGLEGEVRSEYAEHESGLGSTLASADDALRVDHTQYVLLEREFSEANASEREEMLDSAHAQLKDRAAALEQRERDAVRAHAQGDRSDTELLQTLLRNYHEAEAIGSALEDVDDRADTVPGYSLPIDSDMRLLDFHRTQILSGLAAEETLTGEPDELSIKTSETGYQLSTIEGGTYVVETTRFDHRDTDQDDQFSRYERSERFDRTIENYPWADALDGGRVLFHEYGAENLYWLRIDHEDVDLVANFDGGTGEVHREAQELSLSTLPVSNERTYVDDGLELTLNETPANGPVELTVADTTVDEPVAATVSIDGVSIGQTRADGSLWIVPPADDYELTIESETGAMDVTVPNESGETAESA
ncbi:DUF7096 domain-containing protein [Halobiforma nitratireducens]|uniref:Uncharacterized protein n=1 Tax=Halobiforma nitratireducens JCM 10879 TaxID=1227454 RepID=M0LHU9_9EURY|nr:hypothetical protein [Halobiforma nitratireducens]EMA33207.1 hypothetical protein C446_14474 [Halobiforma nitratireducens JCM 10879]